MSVGDRVKLHPATDWWMRGATHGVIRLIGTKWITVELQVGGQLIKKRVKFPVGTDLIEPA